MGRNSAKVNGVDRIIDADFTISEIEYRPSQVRQWFTNNIIRPMLSYTVGWTGRKAVLLRATPAGVLKTASVGSGLTHMEARTGLAETALSTPITFVDVVSRVRIISYDYGLYVRGSADGVSYSSGIEIAAGQESTIDMTMTAYKVQQSGPNSANYRIEGYR